MKKNLLIGLSLAAISVVQVSAQTRTISGRVTDRTTGEGLPGVTVLVKGTTNGVSTNSDGTFSLTAPADATTLSFSSVGYIALERPIAEGAINVALAPDTKQLSEVVITGFGGSQERRTVTGAIASVKAQEVENLPVASVDQALQGRAAGVQISQNSGTPGSGISVRIRGAGSITAGSEPLYVVDGIPINTGSYSSVGVGNQQTNALADLNPNDIESFEVLKDAASTAPFGSRGANGVVIITTKRGRAQQTRVNFNYYTGFAETWRRVPGLTGQQQTELFLEMVQNRYPRNAQGQIIASNISALPWRSYADLAAFNFSEASTRNNGGVLEAVDNGDGIRDVSVFQNPSTAPSTNWQDEIFRRAPVSNYEISFAGGNEKTRFRMSGGFFDQKGIIIESGFKRLSGRFNLDHNVSTRVRTGFSIGVNRAYNNRIQNDNNINGVLSAAVLVASDIPIFRADGSYAKDPGASTENPLAAAREPLISAINSRIIGTQYTELEFIKNLTYRATFGLDYINFDDRTFFPTTTNTGRGVNGSAFAANTQDLNFNHISAFNYTKLFGEQHNVTAQAVVEYQQSRQRTISASATNFPGNSIRELTAGAQKTGASTTGTGYNLFGSFLRLNYSFADKYLIGGTIRRDISSRFGRKNRVGWFPGASIGWRVLEEGFLKDKTPMSELKLRASYGSNGNQDINNFAALSLISPGANYNGVAGLSPSQLGNDLLTWESSDMINVGLDLGFFDNRLLFIADAYRRDARELLLTQTLPSNSGFLGVLSNVGKLRNQGLELSLTTVNVRNAQEGGFEWNTNFNLTFNRNEVLRLAGPPQGAGFASWLEVGQPLGAFRGYRVEKIFQTQEEIDALDRAAQAQYGATARYQSAATRPGDIKFRDINGRDANGNLTGQPDGLITGDDQEILGSGQPDFFGGVNNTLRYKGFDLTVFVQYQYGNEVYNNTRAFSEGMNGVFGQSATVLNRWTPNNTNTDIPRAVLGDPNNNRRVSDRFIEDGSYVRLRNVRLGYSLPRALASRARLNNVSLYVQAQNLLTFTDYSGFDPEVNTFSGSNISLGTDFLTFPQARSYTVGVNFGF
ncbi:SusC/RagA family TonB-linked outer membrane protein [Hymenobacter weizhouensis]|uniref:SusC/RagA family TonB-linked outer membrane protein n=1 Tax=Hymenobacter sp. YIM 151500-1 TaxID=2987689 RepID=UPI002226AF07|nr:TonB-dependent receptor [Hymenobacter sp. YIM 151500-1]UYZ63264.1 TonB-dependent receptor [Hymenobacter sp. YIM 151500-1]